MIKRRRKLTEEHKLKISRAIKGTKKPPRTFEHAQKLGLYHKGEKSNLWKGGISSHPDYGRLKVARRRLKVKDNGGCFTLNEWEELKKIYNNTCPKCGKKEPEIKLTIDHIIPIIKDGDNSIDNLQPLCLSCNSSKHTRIIIFKYNEKEYETIDVPKGKINEFLKYAKSILHNS